MVVLNIVPTLCRYNINLIKINSNGSYEFEFYFMTEVKARSGIAA